MKTYLLLACSLSFCLASSQTRGGMQGGRQGGGQVNQMQERPQREMQKFDASKIAGIFTYDSSLVIKKLKIKKNEKLIFDVKKAINNYNKKVQEIRLLNKDNFDTLNVYMDAIIKASMYNRFYNRVNQQLSDGNDNNSNVRENEAIQKARALSREKIAPARKAVNEEEDKLNKTLEVLLTEKQYARWLKYQEEVKYDLKPKQAANTQSPQMRGGGQRGRQGGGSPRGGGVTR